jgi:hypothetical protein
LVIILAHCACLLAWGRFCGPVYMVVVRYEAKNHMSHKLSRSSRIYDIINLIQFFSSLFFFLLSHFCFMFGRSFNYHHQTAQDIGHVLFSLFNVVWASLYLEAWRRYSVELAFRWGTLSTPPELLEPPRPLYKVMSCAKKPKVLIR